MTCKTPLLRTTTSQTGPGQPGKTPSDKVAYLLNFYILKPTVQVVLSGLQQGGQDHRKVDPSHSPGRGSTFAKFYPAHHHHQETE